MAHGAPAFNLVICAAGFDTHHHYFLVYGMKAFLIILITASAIALSALSPHLMLNPGKLSQGHIKNEKECSSCHQLLKGISSERCIECHKVDEIGLQQWKEDSTNMGKEAVLFHAKLLDIECSSCHTDHKGRDPKLSLMAFNHTLLPDNILATCNSCHTTPKDSLHTMVSVSCNNCHNVSKWKLAGEFNHTQVKASLRNNCTACHHKPTDALHQDLLENCNKCHGTQQWIPADFDHDSYFQLDRDHNVKCATCHTASNYKAYTCYGCHEHSEARIRDEHIEEGITNFTDCASCHQSGDKHDLKKGNYRNGKDQEDARKVREYLKNGHHGSAEKDDD
jgi:hypothetical protein